MVAVTVQLVIASLFSSTTASSVQTPYLKMIDIWYAALITICFLTTIAQVYIGAQIHRKDIALMLNRFYNIWRSFSKTKTSKITTVEPFFVKPFFIENGEDETNKENEIGYENGKKANNVSQLVIFIFFGCFISVYCTMAAIIV